MAGVKRRLHNDSDIRALHKELDEVSCPICMDYPHNAVLLVCSSHDKGCRSYICDTSYRHSNCLDRYKKLKSNSASSSTSSFSRISETSNNTNINIALSNGSLEALRDDANRHNINGQRHAENVGAQGGSLEQGVSPPVEDSPELNLSLKCPLCRGDVMRWEVVEPARNYLNLKSRSCSRESCSFSGNYHELRRHARRSHPMSRPSYIDPSREQAWRHLEHQRDYGDIVSAIRSAIPGAVVVGDYVIEHGDGNRFSNEREDAPWWTTFFLFQMIGAMDSGSSSRFRRRPWRRHDSRRYASGAPERRMLWGENLLGLQDVEIDGGVEENNARNHDDGVEDRSPVPRRRRRLMRQRSWSQEDQ